MKQLLLVFFLVLGGYCLKAQDNIYLKKGEVLEVHIKKVTGSLIYYTGTGGGPQRFLKKSAVEKIVYRNGREVIIPDPKAKKARIQPIPSNLVNVSLNAIFLGNISGFGAGLDYEHYFGERHLISVHVPVYIGILSNQESDENGQLSTAYPYTEIFPFYTAPGIHFHPINARKRLDYAVGISVVIGNVNQTTYYEKSWLGGENVDRQYLFTAVTLDNDLNIFTKKKFAFGLHTAVGPVLGDFGEDGKWLVQVGFKLGFRF